MSVSCEIITRFINTCYLKFVTSQSGLSKVSFTNVKSSSTVQKQDDGAKGHVKRAVGT